MKVVQEDIIVIQTLIKILILFFGGGRVILVNFGFKKV